MNIQPRWWLGTTPCLSESLSQRKTVLAVLEEIGHMPLPPYIDRPDEDSDKERYQTVYNQKPGAVAAPTAGLHFDDALLAKIQAKGAELAYVTLHVGTGTFQPVKVDNIHEHHMRTLVRGSSSAGGRCDQPNQISRW